MQRIASLACFGLLASVAPLASADEFLLVPSADTRRIAAFRPDDGSLVDPAWLDLTAWGILGPCAVQQVGQELWVADPPTRTLVRFSIAERRPLERILVSGGEPRAITANATHAFVLLREPGAGFALVQKYKLDGQLHSSHITRRASDLLWTGSELLVADIDLDGILRSTELLTPNGNFHLSGDATDPLDPAELDLDLAGGRVLVVGDLSAVPGARGVFRYDQAGNFQDVLSVDPAWVGELRGAAALSNGALLLSGSTGVARLAPDGVTLTPLWDAGGAGHVTRIEIQGTGSRTWCHGDGFDTTHLAVCPCGNQGAPGRGCANSVEPRGGALQVSGTLQPDRLLLTASGMPATSTCLFLQEDAAGDAVFQDGVRCSSGALVRLATRAAQAGVARFPLPQDGTTLSARGGVVPGSGARRYYLAVYRNAARTWCPPALANTTNGWILDW